MKEMISSKSIVSVAVLCGIAVFGIPGGAAAAASQTAGFDA